MVPTRHMTDATHTTHATDATEATGATGVRARPTGPGRRTNVLGTRS